MGLASQDTGTAQAVVDHGDGIDPGDGAGLTRRFARGSTADGGGRRFGLGLALVDEVVRAHDGRLEIDGRPGEGSTFTIVLPAAATQVAEQPSTAGRRDDAEIRPRG